MFRSVRASLIGRKVAVQCQFLCAGTVNYLVQKGTPLKLADTARILRECYAFCNAISLRPWMNDLHRGQMLEVSKDILRDFLKKAYAEAAPNLELEEEIGAILAEFVPYLKQWLEQIIHEYPKPVDAGIEAWHPAISLKFVAGIESYIETAFSADSSCKIPIAGFHEYLVEVTSQSADRLT